MNDLGETTTVLNSAEFERTLADWKGRIWSRVQSGEPWALVGIKRRGAILARRLWEDFRQQKADLRMGEVDISLYRDDYHLQNTQPQLLGTEISFKVDGCQILLVDDVLYTGRTVRAAINVILDFGRPRAILLAVLIDRGHRELPIAPDITGMELRTEADDFVQVRLREMDGGDRALLIPGGRHAVDKKTPTWS